MALVPGVGEEHRGRNPRVDRIFLDGFAVRDVAFGSVSQLQAQTFGFFGTSRPAVECSDYTCFHLPD